MSPPPSDVEHDEGLEPTTFKGWATKPVQHPLSTEDNLSLWSEVERTEKAQTKDVSYGSRHFTNVDATYQFKRATALWGPYGRLWGLRNLQWNHYELDSQHNLALTAEFFYPLTVDRLVKQPVEIIVFELAACMRFKPDDDCHKKLQTTCTKKALSKLGFSADVYMGKFDDERYVEDTAADDERMQQLRIRMLKAINDATGIGGKKGLDAIEAYAQGCVDARQLTPDMHDEAVRLSRAKRRILKSKEGGNEEDQQEQAEEPDPEASGADPEELQGAVPVVSDDEVLPARD